MATQKAADESGLEQVEEVKSAAEKPMRPGQCRAYMRRELAREFRQIVKGFVESAKSGSCPHVKLATEMMTSKPQGRPRTRARGAGTVWKLLEKLEQESAEKKSSAQG